MIGLRSIQRLCRMLPLRRTAASEFSRPAYESLRIGAARNLAPRWIYLICRGIIAASRATGASWVQLINYAVQPQVMPRPIGLSLHRLDINFRESAVIGIIGAQLSSSLNMLAWPQVSLIILVILGTVVVSEWVSVKVRHRLRAVRARTG